MPSRLFWRKLIRNGLKIQRISSQRMPDKEGIRAVRKSRAWLFCWAQVEIANLVKFTLINSGLCEICIDILHCVKVQLDEVILNINSRAPPCRIFVDSQFWAPKFGRFSQPSRTLESPEPTPCARGCQRAQRSRAVVQLGGPRGKTLRRGLQGPPAGG